jgi:hypothetical protein
MDRPVILLVYLTFLALATQETSGVSRENVYIDYSFRALRVDIFVGSYQKGVKTTERKYCCRTQFIYMDKHTGVQDKITGKVT